MSIAHRRCILPCLIFAIAGLLGCGGSGGSDVVSPEPPVEPEPPAEVVITISPAELPDAVETRPWLATVEASGGTAPYVWTLEDGPAWLDIEPASGLLWGRPPAGSAGTVLLTVSAEDALGHAGSEQPRLTVAEPAPDQSPFVLAAAGLVTTEHFVTADGCVDCHSNDDTSAAMRDGAGRPIAPYDLWEPTLMADSMRDPYHRAVLRAEIDALPSLQATIEDACLRCHAPLTAYEVHEHGGLASLATVYGDDDSARLALEGNSCTLCHTMVDQGTGNAFDGRYEINDQLIAWAPHASPFRPPMVGTSRFDPALGTHVTESSHCATCHVLRVPTFAPDGTPLGETFPEQTPYFEWQNSIFDTEADDPDPRAASCQDCHMPKRDADGETILAEIARRPGGGDFPPIDPRAPYGRHLLYGGNAFVIAMLRDQAEDLRPRAPTAAFDAAIVGTRAFLRENAAAVRVQDAARTDGRLSFEVAVENRAGHKLPTSFPSRRTWLRVVVRDEAGGIVFASGQVDETGTMVDVAGRVLPSEAAHGPVQPHRDVVTRSHEVPIWEAVAQDHDGHPTWHLLVATEWLKDNRLLPEGWRDDHPHQAEIEPHGVGDDPDFLGGGDVVHYEIDGVPGGPLRIEATLLYQSISARAVYELLVHDELPEVNAFRQYWEAADRAPETIAETEHTVP